MARVYYVDVAVPADKKKRGKHKIHAVFDGSRVFRVKKLTELDDAGEIYIDAMFPQIYGELVELIGRDVRIFSLKSLRLLKRLREENGVEKSDEADARLLSIIPRSHFKQLTLKKLKLLQLINMYERYGEWKRIVRQWASTYPQTLFKKCVKEIRSIQDHYGRKIIEEVMKDEDYAAIYRMACKELGVRDSVEVAILVTRLPLNWRFSRLKGLLGLIPYKNKSYHHKLRMHLARLAANIHINSKKRYRNKQHEVGVKLLEGVESLSLNKTLYTLQLKILRTLKRVWQQQRRHSLAGGQ